MVVICPDSFESIEYNDYFSGFPYPLSFFQKWSIKSIVDGNNSLLTSHTGSGKTLPFLFAIDYFVSRGKKVIYASPIKALSNQKYYEFTRQFPNISCGILTGDIKDSPEASVLIMTTEILRNNLFNKQIIKSGGTISGKLDFDMDFDTDLALVCFDEVHYISDESRGAVWEQSIIMMPKHVQMLMLSATIDKPERFAAWVESQNPTKQVVLSSSSHRIVPLTHYLWLTLHKKQIKNTEKTEYETRVREIVNKRIEITSASNQFNEINYYKMAAIKNYISKSELNISRKFVLNELVRDLHRENMLPAICFVLSRRNVEIFASEIEMNLFESETNECAPPIEYECKNILYSKFNTKTAQEIMLLPEYITTIELMKKGIACHHAGIIPVIREMVELMFERNYIKLLVGTETFAVGVNMPTKTVIFTGLTKFTGSSNRFLQAHEYKQMAGRAGRRGIDTVGHVIHCSNLFDMPTATEYKTIITGPPQMLSSKFKVSYNLILNILSSNATTNLETVCDFVGKSMISEEIKNNVTSCERKLEAVRVELAQKREALKFCQTPESTMIQYFKMKSDLIGSTNKTRTKLLREIKELESDKVFIRDSLLYEEITRLESEITSVTSEKISTTSYLEETVKTIISILTDEAFINPDDLSVTQKGLAAARIQESHSLAIADLYTTTTGFEFLSAAELAAVLSCVTNLSVKDDVQLINPRTSSQAVLSAVLKLRENYNKYYDIEALHKINTGADYNFHYQIIEEVRDWCLCETELECMQLINRIKSEHGIFLGEFIKAILKINNLSAELEKIAEADGNLELLQKTKSIPALTLKYVVTNMSLYI